MSTIIVSAGIPQDGLWPLEGHKVLIPAPAETFTKDEMLAMLPEADAVLACSAMDVDMIRAAAKIKIIANYGAGYDRIDTKTAAEFGVPVTNIPETTFDATAELAAGLMLAVSRRIGEMNHLARTGAPERLFGLGKGMGRTLRGQTLGVLGVGRIGSRTAEIGKALGMHVIGYSRRGADPAVCEPVSFDELIARADVLAVSCPLTPETRGLISREVIAKMKEGAVLINTSRGPVIDHDALADALESGHLYGAGLDVFPEEPHMPERLLALPQVVVTPHVGTNTAQTRKLMAEACCAQILDALAGKRPVNIVNGL